MNTFEYRDTDDDELTIRGDDGNVYVVARANDDGYIAQVAIPNDDAPAVALAILAAALVDADAPTSLGRALRALRKHEKVQLRERAEQAAEDAKVREWMQATEGTNGAHVTDADRRAYHSEREFWERHLAPTDDAHAPHEISHEDPEPDLSTQWRETDGTVWKFENVSDSATGAAGWTPTTGPHRSLHFDWGNQRMCFPMTEVTGRV